MNQFFMLLLKNNLKLLLVLFLISSNFWIYKILGLNFLLAIALVLATLVIVLRIKNIKLTIFCMLILIFFQFQTTHVRSLTLLDNDQQRVQQERIRSYPLTYIEIFSKVLWLKPEIWIEQNKLIIALSRIEENLFGNLDINQYFFAGFPRNNNSDFQKFPFITLPFFIIGLYKMLAKKYFRTLVILLLIPIIILSLIGNDNQFGPFILFPFLILAIFSAIKFLIAKLRK